MRQARFLAVLLLVMMGVSFARADYAVSDERFDKLRRGTNLTGWFWYAPATDAAIRARFADDEFTMLKNMGLTYLRIPIDLGFVYAPQDDDLLNDGRLALISEGVARVQAAGLAVVIDIHSTSLADSDAANYSGALEDPVFVDEFAAFWGSFAAHWAATTDPEMTFLEVMNEPVFYDDPSAWLPIQERLVGVIRAAAPDHTIIVSAARWKGIHTLIEMPLLADVNVVYDFHFYEPFVFTHQGATWSSDEVVNLRGVPYPAHPQSIAPILESHSEADRNTLDYYGRTFYDQGAAAARIIEAVNWAWNNQVRVICTEFGVHSPYAPPEDRARWHQDMREIFEANNVGWAVWDYDANFGIVTRETDGVTPIPAMIAALGLTLP